MYLISTERMPQSNCDSSRLSFLLPPVEVENTVTSVSKMARYYLWITSAAWPAPGLHQRNFCEARGVAGYLAILTPRRALLFYAY